MAIVSITYEDLLPFAEDLKEAKANAMIEDTLARASMVAPCIALDTLTDPQAKAAKAILRKVILRWHDSGSGSGAVTQKSISTGPYQQSESVDTSHRQDRVMFFPTEIAELQALCQGDKPKRGKAFSIDMGASKTYMPSESALWE